MEQQEQKPRDGHVLERTENSKSFLGLEYKELGGEYRRDQIRSYILIGSLWLLSRDEPEGGYRVEAGHQLGGHCSNTDKR